MDYAQFKSLMEAHGQMQKLEHSTHGNDRKKYKAALERLNKTMGPFRDKYLDRYINDISKGVA